MGSTEDLKEAFAGESQANRKYLAFARKAEADGYPQIAKLFRATAEAETVHALAHLRVLGGINGTADNLQVAIKGEAYEFKEMYPAFLKDAQGEDNKPAINTISNALAVEEIHHRLYSEALATLQGGKDLSARPIFVCGVCGNTVYDAAPDRCPICGTPKIRFSEIA